MKEINMLSLQERVLLLQEELSKVSAEELYNELQSYESVGPLAHDFLCDVQKPHSNEYWKQSFNKFNFEKFRNDIYREIMILEVTYLEDSTSKIVTACNDDDYGNSLAA